MAASLSSGLPGGSTSAASFHGNQDALCAAVLAALAGSMSSESNTRNPAERMLAEASAMPGFGPVLVTVVAASGGSARAGDDVRQLAAVVLRKFVKEHWDPSGRHYQPPAASDGDKESVRSALLGLLGDSCRRVRTAVGMVVAAVAAHDYPAQWPSLITDLVCMIQAGRSAEQIHGALRCLSLIADDIDEQQLPAVVPELIPALHTICSSPGADVALRRRCLMVLHGVISALENTAGSFQRKYRDQLLPLLHPWLPLLGQELHRGIKIDQPSEWGVQKEVLKLLMQTVIFFAKFLVPQLPGLLTACWKYFVSGVQVHEDGLVRGRAEEGDADEDGDSLELESLLSQMFELLISMVGHQRTSGLLKPAAPEMMYLTISYMQMTEEQAETWATSTDQYVADEDDTLFSCRTSGELLLEQAQEVFGKDAVVALLDAVERRLQEAAAARAHGRPDWWRLREAAQLAVGCSAEHLVSLARAGRVSSNSGAASAPSPRASAGRAVGARVAGLLQNILETDLQGAELNPFLTGRALWLASKLAPGFLTGQDAAPVMQAFLTAALRGVQPDTPGPVRVGALRLLACLVPLCMRGAPAGSNGHAGGSNSAAGVSGVPSPAAAPGCSPLTAVLPKLYEALIVLLADTNEESLHLVLETLTVVLKADRDAVVASYLPQVALPVLQVWSTNVTDPVVGEDALEVLGALAAARGCLEPLAQHVLPTLAQVVGSPGTQPSMLVESCLDLMRTLLGPRRRDVAAAVWSGCGAQLLSLLMYSTDPGMLQGGVELLCELLLVAGEELLVWAPQPAGGPAPLEAVLGVAHRLLSPGLSESQCVFVGGLVLELLQQHAPRVGHALPQLLDAVVAKLAASNMMPLANGLLLVIAKLALTDAPQLLQVLSGKTVPLPDGRTVAALEAVLPIWLERARDMHGRFRIALCSTALCAVLETRHPCLGEIKVKGRALDSSSGVSTRSRVAATGGAKHSEVSAGIKILMVLADQLADLQEADAPGRRTLLGLDPTLYYNDSDDDYDDGKDAAEDVDADGLHVRGAAMSPDQHAQSDAAALSAGADLFGVGTMDNCVDDGSSDVVGSCSGAGLSRVPGCSGPDDPLVLLDLCAHLSQFFVGLSTSEPQLLMAAGEQMTRRQTKAVQALFVPQKSVQQK